MGLNAIESRNKVLVTGATGFIGTQLVKSLVNHGYCVRVFARQPFNSAFCGLVDECDWIEGELDQPCLLKSACQNVSVVFHVAGLAHSRLGDLEETLKVNVEGTKTVFLAGVDAGVSKFIYFSSILASQPETSHYAKSKRSAEDFLFSHSSNCPDTSVFVLRPATVYGPGMRNNLAVFIRLGKKGLMPSLPLLKRRFPLISVIDLCEAAILAAEANFQKSIRTVFTVTDGQGYTPNRIEDALYRSLERRKPLLRIPRKALYCGALFAQILNVIGITRNQIGLGLYRKLVNDVPEDNQTQFSLYNFLATATLESEMPNIIASIEKN